MNKKRMLFFVLPAVFFWGCGDLGPVDTAPPVTLKIASIAFSPGNQAGIEDTVMAVMHIDPATYDYYGSISVSWSVTATQGTVVQVSKSDSVLTLAMPSQASRVTVTGTAKITVSNQDSKSAAIEVLELARPEIYWETIEKNGVYFQKDSTLNFTIRRHYQDPLTDLGFQITPADSLRVIAGNSGAVQYLTHSLNISALIGQYRIAAWATGPDNLGGSVTGRDTLFFEVRSGVVLPKARF